MTTSVNFRMVAATAVVSVAMILSIVGSAYAAPSGTDHKQPDMAALGLTSNDQGAQEPKIKGEEAKATEPLGATEQVKLNAPDTSKVEANELTPQAGVVASVDFTGLYNYCARDRVAVQVKNNTATPKTIQVKLYNSGFWHQRTVSVAANAYSTISFYGIQGAYTAQLFVWNGSIYQYDESRTGTNTCSVSITRTYNAGGLVQLKYQNTGTAYASVRSTQLAPYAGNFYNYLSAGSVAQYRVFSVGTSPYGIVADVTGSSLTPSYFYGDL